MYRFERKITVRNVADMSAAMQFASDVTDYLNKRYDLHMKYGAEGFDTWTDAAQGPGIQRLADQGEGPVARREPGGHVRQPGQLKALASVRAGGALNPSSA